MIRNIIFDLGGVLFDINYQNIIDDFKKLGIQQFDSLYTQLKQDHLFDQLETGAISASQFRDTIRSIAKQDFDDSQIDLAWNSILIGFPQRNVNLLLELKKQYRIFLLSNTNEIHETAFRKMFQAEHESRDFDLLFEKVYLSHRIHLRKPDPEIFNLVLRENNLILEETLFIDDSLQHVKGAESIGLHSYCLKKDEWVGDIIKTYNLNY
ncbi:MAG: HAD family phosphatase [Bacteroidia bacterium]|nr:HAD family phosphatase [Bacteroidia bacterium]